jgi:hypothetical protein
MPLFVADRGERDCAMLADEIRDQVGRLGASDVEARIGELVATGRSIEAVSLAGQDFGWSLEQARGVRAQDAGRARPTGRRSGSPRPVCETRGPTMKPMREVGHR